MPSTWGYIRTIITELGASLFAHLSFRPRHTVASAARVLSFRLPIVKHDISIPNISAWHFIVVRTNTLYPTLLHRAPCDSEIVTIVIICYVNAHSLLIGKDINIRTIIIELYAGLFACLSFHLQQLFGPFPFDCW